MENFIYLDYASTSPVEESVINEMLPYFNKFFGNYSSSSHSFGDIAKNAVLKSQQKIADLINSQQEEIYFTSGATESINLALKGVYFGNIDKGNHIITVKTEHKAVLDTCHYLEEVGADITYLDVNEEGLINLDELKSSVKKTTILICIMHVNNETGVLQPIEQIGEFCNENRIIFMTDATQAYGKINLDVKSFNIDLLCFSGHKIYGPKGIGGLFIKKGITLQMQIHGGAHQKKIRSGTLNVSGIVGLGKASEIAKTNMNSEYKRVEKLRDLLENKLVESNKIKVNGIRAKRSPYISNIQLTDQEADDFILRNRTKIAIATGSACNSELIEPSHVLKAMGFDKKECDSSIRISYGSKNKTSDIENLLNLI